MSGLALAIAIEAATKGYREGLIKDAHARAVEIATEMLKDHATLEYIMRYAKLPEQEILDLAVQLGIIVWDAP